MPTNILKRVALTRDFPSCMIFLAFANLFPTVRLVRKNLTGKKAIVTGGDGGISLWYVQEMVRMRCTIYLACRSLQRGNAAVEQIKVTIPGAKVHVVELNASSAASVRSFAKVWDGKRIHYIFYEAGICRPTSAGQRLTTDGLEIISQTSFLGTDLLPPIF